MDVVLHQRPWDNSGVEALLIFLSRQIAVYRGWGTPSPHSPTGSFPLWGASCYIFTVWLGNTCLPVIFHLQQFLTVKTTSVCTVSCGILKTAAVCSFVLHAEMWIHLTCSHWICSPADTTEGVGIVLIIRQQELQVRRLTSSSLISCSRMALTKDKPSHPLSASSDGKAVVMGWRSAFASLVWRCSPNHLHFFMTQLLHTTRGCRLRDQPGKLDF